MDEHLSSGFKIPFWEWAIVFKDQHLLLWMDIYLGMGIYF